MKKSMLLILVCAASLRVSAQGTWNLEGNFVSPGQFLGSTNFEAVDVRVNGLRGWRVEPDPRPGGLSPNLIGGFISNRIEQPGSGGNFIGGGGWFDGPNIMRTNTQGAFIGAGSANEIGPNINDGVIGGGYGNVVRGYFGVIGGGYFGHITPNGYAGVIAGGYQNTNNGPFSFIGGGIFNVTGPNYDATVAGGSGNTASGASATVGGGQANLASGMLATVPGGGGNTAAGQFSFAAGYVADALHDGSFVWSDASDGLHFPSTAANQFSVRANGGVRFVSSGAGMTLDGRPVITSQPTADDLNHSNMVNVVNGSPANIVNSGVFGGTIAGGGASHYNGINSWENAVTADFGTVSGGGGNTSVGVYATVGGGSGNTSSGGNATVAGGINNSASGNNAVTGGGGNNSSSGAFATVPGGFQNSAAGNFSFAAGQQASAQHNGAFVWSDSSGGAFASTSNHQFLVRAAGGVGIGTNNPQAALEVFGNWNGERGALKISGDRPTIRMSGGTPAANQTWLIHVGGDGPGNLAFYRRTGPASYQNVMNLSTNGRVGIGITNPTNKLHVAGGVSATAFVSTSDRNAKTNFAPVDVHEVLTKVAALPITRWKFKDMPDGQHMGPMAQDFHAAFGLGDSDTTITSVDPDGVALAAIQGLNQKLEEQVKEKESRIQSLERRLAELEKLVAKATAANE